MKSKKGFIWKLDKPEKPEFIEIKPEQEKRWGKGTMVIPQTRLIQSLIRIIPYGKLITNELLRKKIADHYEVDFACPLTSGIFINIIAYATEEAIEKQISEEQVPYWRVLQKDGSINPKFPKGLEYQAKLLEDEGFQIFRKTPKKYYVIGYEQFLM